MGPLDVPRLELMASGLRCDRAWSGDSELLQLGRHLIRDQESLEISELRRDQESVEVPRLERRLIIDRRGSC
jgi:hypothetical protein